MDPTTTGIPEAMWPELYWMAFDFVVIALAVFATVTSGKHLVLALGGKRLDTPVGQALLRLAPVTLGIVASLVPGVFDGCEIGLKALLGSFAGFTSEGVYNQVKARFPAIAASKESPKRLENGDE